MKIFRFLFFSYSITHLYTYITTHKLQAKLKVFKVRSISNCLLIYQIFFIIKIAVLSIMIMRASSQR